MYKKTIHPHLDLGKWLDGTLCFWRNNSLYSQKEQDRLDKELIDHLGGNIGFKKRLENERKRLNIILE